MFSTLHFRNVYFAFIKILKTRENIYIKNEFFIKDIFVLKVMFYLVNRDKTRNIYSASIYLKYIFFVTLL